MSYRQLYYCTNSVLNFSVTDSYLNHTATTEIYTLSLHDALPICASPGVAPPTLKAMSRSPSPSMSANATPCPLCSSPVPDDARSEEHTSELQSRLHLVCRLLLEKKKIKKNITIIALNALHTTRQN